MKELPTGAFVRCSTRSPKDSQVSRAKSKAALEKLLIEGQNDANQKLIVLLKAQLQG